MLEKHLCNGKAMMARPAFVLAAAFCLCVGCPLTFGPAGGVPADAPGPAPETETENGLGGGGGAVPEAYQDGSGETPGASGAVPGSPPTVVTYSVYTIAPGDTINAVAGSRGLYEDTLLSVNHITNSRVVRVNQVILIPNQNGILYTVKKGDTLDSIAKAHNVEAAGITAANELFPGKEAAPGSSLFIPGARMDRAVLLAINGSLFITPVNGRFTSHYGFRRSPFTGARQWHDGIDFAAPLGTPVKAAMPGTVESVAYDDPVFGINVTVRHHSGYKTRYCHLNEAAVQPGVHVAASTVIGYVGNTGISTGPHLHFTVYKNGGTINPRMVLR
ncbi:MAG: M23 family peptidase [Treponematales bacterium]